MAGIDRTLNWFRTTAESMRRLVLGALPYLKVALAMALTVGPWVYAIHRSDSGFLLMMFGLVLSFIFTYHFTWRSGAIFGIISVTYLGPILTAIAPIVTTKTIFYIVAAASGFFFALLYSIGLEVAALGEKKNTEQAFSGETLGSQWLLFFQFLVVPGAALVSLNQSIQSVPQDMDTLTGGAAAFYACDLLCTFIMMNISLNLRPAIVFYRELKPLLRAMRAGLVSFAIGYGLTIFLFAGFYAALYRYNPDFFPTPEGQKTAWGLWDFIYFSVTSITTIGLSEVKPHVQSFWPQAVVSAELIVGIFWIVIYFAVAMTLLQAYVSELLAKLAKSSPPQS